MFQISNDGSLSGIRIACTHAHSLGLKMTLFLLTTIQGTGKLNILESQFQFSEETETTYFINKVLYLPTLPTPYYLSPSGFQTAYIRRATVTEW